MTDIARLAGVSASTVSRALSGSTLIPQTTRERIHELARTLNYQVNVGAASLRKRDIKTMGVVILGESSQVISDPFLLSILGSIADALDARGMSLMLTRLQGAHPGSLTTMFDNGQVAGLIVIGQLTLHEHLNQLAHQGLPIVVWGANLPDAAYSVVGGDNAAGGFLATQHLISQGCKRIAFFGDTTHPEAGQRFMGYQRAMNDAGYGIDARLIQPFLFGDIRIRETIDRWLNLHIEVDAIFATSDVTAISLMGALSERGIAVPAQVKLVGYDDIFLAAHIHPSLTTIRQPTEQAGHVLVDLLFEVIQGHPRRVVTLPAELVLRDSSISA
jgi:DNA-binding LacI/PurR family transcriptional regulator